jgi:hypothetical protein
MELVPIERSVYAVTSSDPSVVVVESRNNILVLQTRQRDYIKDKYEAKGADSSVYQNLVLIRIRSVNVKQGIAKCLLRMLHSNNSDRTVLPLSLWWQASVPPFPKNYQYPWNILEAQEIGLHRIHRR